VLAGSGSSATPVMSERLRSRKGVWGASKKARKEASPVRGQTPRWATRQEA